MKSFFENMQNESEENKKEFARAELIQNVTEDILIAMEDLNISKATLAEKIGKSKSYITQILSGSRNMTLASLSDLCFELNITPSVKILEDAQKYVTNEYTLKVNRFSWNKAEHTAPRLRMVKKSDIKAISISQPKYQNERSAA